VVWLVGVATTTSGRAIELVPLRVTGAGCMNMLHQLKNSKKMNKNEETESLMIGNILELIEAARREVVVGEVATATTESLAAAALDSREGPTLYGEEHRSWAREGLTSGGYRFPL
jgi:hypothetical protein